MTEKISDAVVLHGPGRSGTTLFSRILSTHSAFAWISGYVNRFPGYPVLSVFNRVMEIDTGREVQSLQALLASSCGGRQFLEPLFSLFF